MTSVALLGVQQGIMIAVLGSLVERLRREYPAADAVLLRDGIIADWAEDRQMPATNIAPARTASSLPL